MSKVVTIADEVLKLSTDDKDAIHCKVVALVQQSDFKAALTVITSSSHRSSFAFEEAYCHYGIKDYATCLSCIDQSLDDLDTSSSFRFLELKAQTLYRLERADESVRLYHKLSRTARDDRHEERQTNLLAAAAMAQSDQLEVTDGCYEEAYNSACWLMTQSRYEEALEMLEKANELCKEYFEHDPEATEEEIANSIALLECQRVVALHMQGKYDEAKRGYKQLLKTAKSNSSVTGVACVNIIALHGDSDVFDSKKRLKTVSTEAILSKMTSQQRLVLAANTALLHLYAGSQKLCLEACNQMRTDYPSNSIAGLIHAAALLKDKHTKDPVAEMKELRNMYDDNDTLVLVHCQALIKAGRASEVAGVLASRPSLLHSPAVVGYRVASAPSNDVAQELMAAAVEYWRKQDTEPHTELKVLLRESARRLMEGNNYKAAVAPLEELVSLDPEDAASLAQLVLALTHVDVKQAEQYADSLPAVQHADGGNVDLDELEAAATLRVNKFKSKREADLPSLATIGATVVKAKRKRRKRPGKLPKDFHPNKTPDPERWLKKYERSSFGGRKKKKRQAEQFYKGSQGDAERTAAAAKSLDASLRQPPPVTEAKKPSSKSKKKPNKGKKKKR
eukprot:TRINITY_DN7495_c0_g1_i1.p1 TRINITY_DN7495_c0_g1~~TRINITY_DN7495_c0_g1_i1.p1  ORF type:complete len:642 (+),score=220.58 TRINITY_DN7495_c0_g1_i1:69-1928(+)